MCGKYIKNPSRYSGKGQGLLENAAERAWGSISLLYSLKSGSAAQLCNPETIS